MVLWSFIPFNIFTYLPNLFHLSSSSFPRLINCNLQPKAGLAQQPSLSPNQAEYGPTKSEPGPDHTHAYLFGWLGSDLGCMTNLLTTKMVSPQWCIILIVEQDSALLLKKKKWAFDGPPITHTYPLILIKYSQTNQFNPSNQIQSLKLELEYSFAYSVKSKRINDLYNSLITLA